MAHVARLTDVRGDYACDARRIGHGGYAEVFAATHKPTGRRVALKRLNPGAKWSRDDAVPRMRREIDVMRAMNGHRHVMPVLAADPDGHWYVMPLAAGDLVALRNDLSDEALRDVLCDVADALSAAHAEGFVHRDVTPMNILRLKRGDRWVLADWGLVRRPRGQTTTRLTGSAQPVGTDGFVAPELLRGAHSEASPASDVFSLGRVAAWAAEGRVPLAGEILLPSGPFRQPVREATHGSVHARCSLQRFVELLDEVGYTAPLTPHERAAQLAEQARQGDASAAARLLDHADEHPDDQELFLDVLPTVGAEALKRLVGRDPEAARRLADAMREHLTHGDSGRRSYDAANAPLRWLSDMCGAAQAAGDTGLLEDAADDLFESAAEWQRFKERDRTRVWLNRLQGDEAAAVARALRRQRRAADWYADEAWQPSSRMHRGIRSALS